MQAMGTSASRRRLRVIKEVISGLPKSASSSWTAKTQTLVHIAMRYVTGFLIVLFGVSLSSYDFILRPASTALQLSL
jgi:hypothetical protein